MADINNNFTEITENFDTIKTLLNSIRAQGILNTTDVDKLLTGINSKLEKINTEEDIDLIKIFLSELKQNLDERHDVLLSKFGAIESLFTNLLKNSADSLKSSEVKELFDIVATNLSVFSREVVSQKDILNDITLRIDAFRSDDSKKNEIIKSVTVLKNDIDRLTNGFDSIVLSLNDNFKTIIKTIASIDPSENLSKFGSEIADIVNSTSTILSAIQMLDKKNSQIEDILSTLATQDDMVATKKWISDLANHEQSLTQSIDNLTDKYYKIDNLAEKIDASVDIIVNLKSIIETREEQSSSSILDLLNNLQNSIENVSTIASFNEFKSSFEKALQDITANSTSLQAAILSSSDVLNKIEKEISALDINVNFKSLLSDLNKSEQNIKEHVSIETDQIKQLFDVNTTRTLGEISSSAETLENKISQTHSIITDLCKKSFLDVEENITGLKTVVAQIDENNVSANNAIFSNITDRLAMFENSLKTSLEKQENYVSTSSNELIEQVNSIKDLSGILDYKFDASNIQISDAKKEFSTLKNAIEDVLALDFVNKVKDLKVDLYAIKQELVDGFETSSTDLSDNVAKDLFGKYELLTSKLDSVENQIKQAQEASLSDVKSVLDTISSSIVDVLSYVSSKTEFDTSAIDSKLESLDKVFSDHNLNYVETVRDVVEVIRTQVDNNLKSLQEDTVRQISNVNNFVETKTEDIKADIKNSYDKLLEIQDKFDIIKETISSNNTVLSGDISSVISSAEALKAEFDNKLQTLKSSILDKVAEFQQDFTCENADKISEIKFAAENLHTKSIQNSITMKQELRGEIEQIIGKLKLDIEELSEHVSATSFKVENASSDVLGCIKNDLATRVGGAINELETKVSDYSDDIELKVDNIIAKFENVELAIQSQSESANDSLKENVDILLSNFEKLCDRVSEVDNSIDEDLASQLAIIENNFELLNQTLQMLMSKSDEKLEEQINAGLENVQDTVKTTIINSLDQYKQQVEDLFENLSNKNETQALFIAEKANELNKILNSTLEEQNNITAKNIEEISLNLRDILSASLENSANDYVVLQDKLLAFSNDIDSNNKEFQGNLKDQIDSIVKYIDSNIEIQAQETCQKFNDLINKIGEIVYSLSLVDNKFETTSSDVMSKIGGLDSNIEELKNAISTMFEEFSLNIISQYTNSTTNVVEDFNNKTSQFIAEFDKLNTKFDDDSIQNMNVLDNQIKALNTEFSKLILDAQEVLKTEMSSLSNSLITNSTNLMNVLNQSIEEKSTHIVSTNSELVSQSMQTIENLSNSILSKIEENKQSVISCKNFIDSLVKNDLKVITESIETEASGIITDLVNQFNLMKDFEKDEFSKLVGQVESIVDDHIYNNISDLKSYLDVKMNTSDINIKMDAISNELTKSAEDMLSASNKLLETTVFSDAISDVKQTNEILINTMADNLNKQITSFVKQNVTDNVSNKLNLFDKKFTDTIIEKYEEVKLISTKYNNVFESIEASIKGLIDNFVSSKNEINQNISKVLNDINTSLSELSKGFFDLKAQMLNKSFDEAFQASVNKQINGIEGLMNKQFGYLEEISELCESNLPELTEMNAIVKYNLLESIEKVNKTLENQNSSVQQELNTLKTDVITQFINVFNQISFVTEQEEILDFIQEKHTELIKILSNIVETIDDVKEIKHNVLSVDRKVDSLREDIDLINDKITAIISSSGDIDYVYSLQDLESDIANLRISLNEVKEKADSKELEALINSTNDIYTLVDSIKQEINCFNTDEFRKDFESLNEDIVSISTRTNKLILASDESYKTLQDNLQDFKLVINDLDERTRNFARESGMDKLDNKLTALNTMIQSGAKTNQVFNQVFEYLAEWVDSAGAQITSISDKVDTLDDIGQIKVMLEDLKANSEDSTEGDELVQALESIFDKQAKKIASLEAKLDRVIVETTINSKNNKLDLTPLEDTLNKFLVAIDDKIVSQQSKIDMLQLKVDDVATMINPKDAEQLSKKVGSMDRRIVKLNKSIEKIASHVIEE